MTAKVLFVKFFRNKIMNYEERVEFFANMDGIIRQELMDAKIKEDFLCAKCRQLRESAQRWRSEGRGLISYSYCPECEAKWEANREERKKRESKET